MKWKPSPRAALLIIAAVFLLPLMLAWFMYNGTIEFKPAATRNFGQLIEPPLPINWKDVALLPNTGNRTTDAFAEFGKHWTILFPVPDGCPESCLQQAVAFRQIHRALGRQQDRVRIALLLQNGEMASVETSLRDSYSGFHLVRDPAESLESALQQASRGPGTVYLIDPLGNIMMAYEGGADPNNLKQDLKRLLTWSKLDEQ